MFISYLELFIVQCVHEVTSFCISYRLSDREGLVGRNSPFVTFLISFPTQSRPRALHLHNSIVRNHGFTARFKR